MAGHVAWDTGTRNAHQVLVRQEKQLNTRKVSGALRQMRCDDDHETPETSLALDLLSRVRASFSGCCAMHDVQTRTSEMGMVCAVIVCQDHIPKDVGIPCTAAPSTFDIRHTWQSEQLVEARHKRAFLNPTLPAASRSENAAKMPISESHVDRTSPREFQSSGIVYSSTAAWKRHHGGIHPTLINIKRPRHSRKEGVAQCTGDDLPRAGASSTGRLRRRSETARGWRGRASTSAIATPAHSQASTTTWTASAKKRRQNEPSPTSTFSALFVDASRRQLCTSSKDEHRVSSTCSSACSRTCAFAAISIMMESRTGAPSS